MQNPLEITFKDIPHNSRIEQIILEKYEKIKHISRDVIKCHVIMEKLSKHHQNGNMYAVKLDLKLANFPDIIIKDKSVEGEMPMATAVRSIFKKAHELTQKQIGRSKKKVAMPEEVEEAELTLE